MKLTVAIPTIAGRSMYLASCLRTCVSQDEDFEILVSNNSTETEALEIVNSLGDERVRYVTPPSYLPMSAHWDFVLSQVTGDVLTIIGDDDGLMPSCVKRVREIRSRVGDMPIHHAFCDYRWPDYIFEASRNKAYLHYGAGPGCRIVDSTDYLTRVARGTIGYQEGPMVYHNFVPVPLIRALINQGTFFRRASPDVYSSFAVAANCPRFFSTDEVLTVSGQGAKGNGAAFSAGGAGEFSEEMRKQYTPRFDSRTLQFHMLDALKEVVERFGRPDIEREIRFGTFAARALAEVRVLNAPLNELKSVWALMCENQAVLSTAAAFASLTLQKAAKKLRLARPDRSMTFSRGAVISMDARVQNIYDASLALSAVLATGAATSSVDAWAAPGSI